MASTAPGRSMRDRGKQKGPRSGPPRTSRHSLGITLFVGLALLLVAAGAIGFVVRRYQSRGGPSPS